MTSRNSRQSPAKARPARMSIARAISRSPAPASRKSAPNGSSPLTGAKPRSAVASSAKGAAPSNTRGAAPAAPAVQGPVQKTRARGSASALRADQKRLADLKVKLSDPEYMNGAILRIATVLSAKLTLR